MSSGKAKAADAVDHNSELTHEDDPDIDGSASGSEPELDDPSDGILPVASSSATSKKKKKKKSKAARALAALKGDTVPQQIVDTVLKKVKEEHGEDTPGADAETVRQLLEQLKIKDVIQGKSGLGGLNKKDAGDHKVRQAWWFVVECREV